MTNAFDGSLSIPQALEVLSKLQAAVPAAASTQLRQVAGLLQSLVDENTYLNSLVMEGIGSTGTPVLPPHDAPDIPVQPDTDDDLPDKVHEDEASELPVLVEGLNDALRPPLVAIRGRAELVQAGLLGQITSDQDIWLQSIQENTDRAFAVLNAIQELLAIQKGETRIEKVNFISTDLLKEAWNRLRDKARESNHEVTIQAPDTVPLAHGDFYQSLIVLTDLLDNAMRYTPNGGQIRMSVDNLGTHALFTVADNGIGLTPDDLEAIGRPFWRGDHHRLVRQHAGTGLRICLAKQMLPLMGGELIYSGEPGLGSTFSFTLPTPE